MEIQLQNTTFYKICDLHAILTKYISLSVLSDSLKRMLKLKVNNYWKHYNKSHLLCRHPRLICTISIIV